jgi:hypothetical protein
LFEDTRSDCGVEKLIKPGAIDQSKAFDRLRPDRAHPGLESPLSCGRIANGRRPPHRVSVLEVEIGALGLNELHRLLFQRGQERCRQSEGGRFGFGVMANSLGDVVLLSVCWQ